MQGLWSFCIACRCCGKHYELSPPENRPWVRSIGHDCHHGNDGAGRVCCGTVGIRHAHGSFHLISVYRCVQCIYRLPMFVDIFLSRLSREDKINMNQPFPQLQIWNHGAVVTWQDGMFGEPPLTYIAKNGWWGEPVQFFVQHINNCQQLGSEFQGMSTYSCSTRQGIGWYR